MNPMSTQDAAEYLGVSARTIFRLINRGSIKAQKFGNSWMIDRGSVAAYKKTIEGKAKYDPTRGKIEDKN